MQYSKRNVLIEEQKREHYTENTVKRNQCSIALVRKGNKLEQSLENIQNYRRR